MGKIITGHRGNLLFKISCGKPIVTEDVSMPVSQVLNAVKTHSRVMKDGRVAEMWQVIQNSSGIKLKLSLTITE